MPSTIYPRTALLCAAAFLIMACCGGAPDPEDDPKTKTPPSQKKAPIKDEEQGDFEEVPIGDEDTSLVAPQTRAAHRRGCSIL